MTRLPYALSAEDRFIERRAAREAALEFALQTSAFQADPIAVVAAAAEIERFLADHPGFGEQAMKSALAMFPQKLAVAIVLEAAGRFVAWLEDAGAEQRTGAIGFMFDRHPHHAL